MYVVIRGDIASYNGVGGNRSGLEFTGVAVYDWGTNILARGRTTCDPILLCVCVCVSWKCFYFVFIYVTPLKHFVRTILSLPLLPLPCYDRWACELKLCSFEDLPEFFHKSTAYTSLCLAVVTRILIRFLNAQLSRYSVLTFSLKNVYNKQLSVMRV